MLLLVEEMKLVRYDEPSTEVMKLLKGSSPDERLESILSQHADATKAASLRLADEIFVSLGPMLIEIFKRHVEGQVSVKESQGGVVLQVPLMRSSIFESS